MEEIAETFADHYYTVTQADSSLTAHDNHLPNRWTETENGKFNSPITTNEVRSSIRTLKNSSPGPDGIYAIMLKNLSYQQLEALTFFNCIWQEHCFLTPGGRPIFYLFESQIKQSLPAMVQYN